MADNIESVDDEEEDDFGLQRLFTLEMHVAAPQIPAEVNTCILFLSYAYVKPTP